MPLLLFLWTEVLYPPRAVSNISPLESSFKNSDIGTVVIGGDQNQNRSKQPTKMEEDHGNSNSSITVDTTKWDRSVWLMKCPLVVSKSWQSQAAASSSSSDSPQVAKVIVSVDPLRSDDSSALQVKLSFISSTIFQPHKNKTNSVSITDLVGSLCGITVFFRIRTLISLIFLKQTSESI